MTVTGNYPGCARNADELRADLDKAYLLIPGKHRLNLHAIYAETNGKQADNTGDPTGRLALLEEIKTLPVGAVWDEHCRREGVPVGRAWIDEVKAYESGTLSERP